MLLWRDIYPFLVVVSEFFMSACASEIHMRKVASLLINVIAYIRRQRHPAWNGNGSHLYHPKSNFFSILYYHHLPHLSLGGCARIIIAIGRPGMVGSAAASSWHVAAALSFPDFGAG
jgi:hypothetical protein